jgi:hypothetical protein
VSRRNGKLALPASIANAASRFHGSALVAEAQRYVCFLLNPVRGVVTVGATMLFPLF